MKRQWSKAGVIAAGNVLILLLCLALLLTDSLKVISNQLYDFNMKATMSREPHEDILVVAIDTQSIKEIGPYPWDRSVYADLIERMEAGGAKVIAFDIELYTESSSGGDGRLAEALAKYDNIIVPSHADVESRLQRSTLIREGEPLRAEGAVDPIPAFRKVWNRAHINATFDDTDGTIRSNWMTIVTPQGTYPTLALAAAQAAGADVSRYLDPPQLPGKPQGEALIRWTAGEYDFETIPFTSVIKGAIPPEVFKDRLVLIGYTVTGADEGITPVEKHMHLVYAHANLLHQILSGELVAPVRRGIDLALAVFVMLVLGLMTWRMSEIGGALLALGVFLLLLAGQFVLFAASDQYLDTLPALACGLIAYLGNIAMKTYFESKQRQYITRQFGRYISPDLVREIARSEQDIRLGGISKELTVLFLDVRGFTPLSEKLKPEEVVDLLNMMFNLITERALRNRGTIDKFIGDAAMILFNAPLDVPDHPYRAVKTAYEIQEGMRRVREEVRDKYGVDIAVGIGIHTGEVVVGNIGSYLRMEYTAIGDNVNTAARIESSTQPNQILVSEATYARTGGAFAYRDAGEKLMKGKSLPLRLYEVIAPQESSDKERTAPKVS
ncbi:CHASE2 domain-containing protein [Paenibacillus mucilaginosus]|uniref:Adenylate cyclase family 3-like protein n=3 Tax=Paenibacillus mucilaginosus TaxID=61624 RepID=H6NJ79_9BACL|nr:adenylate/guanylate cyclase domain-containing protein [Paenibacillus mucilaginosus]AEI40196.1 Adenylate cyclase family 3-like protein [Paenibacillus mucilaginosus KNP414]AFC28841.1 Adenylate cyclase family 3-like protein [Paenibacillus mucilaginosus 3016]AFH61017.1 adenylate cyclase [Paenibacillus mucilaginosus K02]MCG7215796.1 adenylate/guanylate cyclase domain-containing protein [Paenibacillus mucilaginosus]WDM29422.1 adenylate/guanylate cyclase domain-containing protein [Paenibacillus mu